MNEGNDGHRKRTEAGEVTDRQIRTFLREVLVLFVGLALGFFWRTYYEQVSNEAHIIILQLLVILALGRYIQIIQSGDKYES